MASCDVRRLHFWLGCVAAASLTAAGSAAQTALSLNRLTVPARALPSGCRVRPYGPTPNAARISDPSRVTVSAGSPLMFPGNPWVGTDRQLLNRLLGTDTMPLPDGPPPTRHDLGEMQSEAVQHVREGYRAVYDSKGGAVEVRALRFDDEQGLPAGALAIPDRRPGSVMDHFAIGAVSVQVAANPETECARAIDAYLRALK